MKWDGNPLHPDNQSPGCREKCKWLHPPGASLGSVRLQPINRPTLEQIQWPLHQAGSKQRNHLRVTLLWDGKRIHTNYGRVVFAWCTGAWPIHDVDHIDRDWTNNRIHNLRDADRRTNIQNRSVFTGATFNKRAQKWRSQIVVNGKQKHLGTFSSKAEAQAAYFAALSELVS